jgi:hypothetical protein
MRRRLFRSTLVLAAAAALMTAGSPAALAGGDSDHGHGVPTVHVVGNGSSARVDDASVPAGTVRFQVSTTGAFSAVTMFSLKNGATLGRFFDDVRLEFAADAMDRARGTSRAKHDATFYGLADVVPGFPLTVTENLRPGTYWLMDLTTPPTAANPPVTRFRVTDGRSGTDGADGRDADVQVRLAGDRFLAPRVWPHEGSWSLTNADDTLHFMLLQPVKPGTTDTKLQAALEQGTQTALYDGTRPAVGSEVVSPGITHTVGYDLPRGRYALLCFVADESDGMPHAVMGMHLVIDLR